MTLTKWVLTEEEQTSYMYSLARELAPLRAKARISQIDLCRLIGISRQTYSAIESLRRPMTWQTYLSLIWFFDSNRDTREMLRSLPAYPRALLQRLDPEKGHRQKQPQNGEIPLKDYRKMWKELDEQAVHSLKTLFLVEYARCQQVPAEVLIRTFEGLCAEGISPDAATQLALQSIRSIGRDPEGYTSPT